MTEPTREQMAETVRVGMQVAAQMNREELERQLRCVQLYGYGYLLNHGGRQIALDPKDVTVVLPSMRHMDDFDLHNSLYLAEQQVQVLQERIAKAGAFLRGCAEASDGMCGYGQKALAVLDGEVEETVDLALEPVNPADLASMEAIGKLGSMPGLHVQLEDEEAPRANGGILKPGTIYNVGESGCVLMPPTSGEEKGR